MYLQEKGHEVFGVDRNLSRYVKSIIGDTRDTGLLRTLITEGKYDSVVNCISILNQFAEQDKALATFSNSYLPHFLAEVTCGTDTQIIHISTDCVFSGKRGEYTEADFPDGTTFYNRSKALGELEDDKNITLRTSTVGPDINPDGIGLMNWFMKQQGEIVGFTKAIWTGQTSLQLAKTVEAAAKEKAHGLYNMVPTSSICKYNLLQLFNHYLRNDSIKITPVEGINADKSLKRTRFEFGYLIPEYEPMIAELTEWIIAHKDMYPHYKL